MTKNQAVQELLNVIPTLTFCSRPHLKKSYDAIRQVGGRGKKNSISKGDPVELDIRHYITIFLIRMLSSEGRPCRRSELKDLFLWKWPGQESTFEGMIMKRLRAIDAIRQESADYPSTEKNVSFTEAGVRILDELRHERAAQIDAMLSILGKKDGETYSTIVKETKKLASTMWKEVRETAKLQDAETQVNRRNAKKQSIK